MFSVKSAPKVKESGFAIIPRGIYEASFEFADLIETKAGDWMYKMTYQITENSGYANRKLFDNIMWTYAPKTDSAEDKEKAAYTLEQAHGKLADVLFAVGSEGFDTENPGEVIDILFGKDVLIKLGVREDKQKGEQVNFVETVYSVKSEHRTRAKAPTKNPTVPAKPYSPTRAPAPRQPPIPAIQNQVSPQEIINRQHKAQAPVSRSPSPYQPQADEDVSF